jgi:hypothetical protein
MVKDDYVVYLYNCLVCCNTLITIYFSIIIDFRVINGHEKFYFKHKLKICLNSVNLLENLKMNSNLL